MITPPEVLEGVSLHLCLCSFAQAFAMTSHVCLLRRGRKAVLGLEPRASSMQGKHAATELQLQAMILTSLSVVRSCGLLQVLTGAYQPQGPCASFFHFLT